ncbi:hypothetical protein BUE80_DR011904 [Diplocarpon rosae]|nr:hypothetical protein BUE80_DR011904 [Diplocarpon rosae]
MQFTTLTTVIFLAMASTGMAACDYQTNYWVSTCVPGDNGKLFCTGNTNICSTGLTASFDTQATKANEDACGTLNANDGCTQTACCS